MTVCMRQMSEIHNEAFGNMQKTVDVSTKVPKMGRRGWDLGGRPVRWRGLLYPDNCSVCVLYVYDSVV